jgi:hypothetical protein
MTEEKTLYQSFKDWIHPNGVSIFEAHVAPALPGMEADAKKRFTQACVDAHPDRSAFKARPDDPELLRKNVAAYLSIMAIAREAGVAVPDLGPPPEAP